MFVIRKHLFPPVHSAAFSNLLNEVSLEPNDAAARNELRAISRERDPDIFYSSLLNFGYRQEDAGNEALAAQAYRAIQAGAREGGKAPLGVVKRASSRLSALTGQGGSMGDQVEGSLHHFQKELPTMLLTMTPGWLGFKAMRLIVGNGFVNLPVANALTRGLVPWLASTLAGMGVEGSILTAIQHGLGQGTTSWGKDLLTNYQVMLGMRGVGEAAIRFSRMLGLSPGIGQSFVHQVSTLGGMYLTQDLSPTQMLVNLGYFHLTGVLASGILGKHFVLWEQASESSVRRPAAPVPAAWRGETGMTLPRLAYATAGAAEPVVKSMSLRLATMRVMMKAGREGISERNEGAPYREIYKFPPETTKSRDVLPEIIFEGEEWRGVVETINRISDLMEEKLEAGYHRGQRDRTKRALHGLLRAVDEYSPESFFFALEVFESALLQGIPFDHVILDASIAKRNLDCFLGETLKPDPEWEQYLKNIAGQLNDLAEPLRPKFMRERRAFYKVFNEALDRISYSVFPSEIRRNISQEFRDILLLPGLETAKEQLQALTGNADAIVTLQRSLQVSAKERRPVVWNPLAHPGDRDYILHPSLGEGWIMSEEEGGRLKVKFPDREAVIVLESAIARPEEEKYEKILIDRTIRFSHLPYNYVPLVLLHYLSHEEATSVRNRLYGKNVSSLDLSGDSQTHSGSVGQSGIRELLKKNLSVSSSKQIKWLTEETSKFAKKNAQKLGIDPIAFVLRLMVGEYPSKEVSPNHKQYNLDKMFGDRIMTPDLVRGFLQTRPWMENWGQEGIFKDSPVKTAGYYYPSLYKGSDRPLDLTELYFAFREGDESAFDEVQRLMQEPIQKWAVHRQHEAPVVLVPMIGQAPLEKLARKYDLPVSFPWRPRPANYGKGVEGQRTSVKMQMVQQAMNLDLDKLQEVQGKSVLLLDDNLTDGVTYIHARKLLLEAGAKEIGLMLLTRTIRTPEELSWEKASSEQP